MGYSSADPANYIAVGKQADKDTEATTFKFLKYLGDSGFNVELDTESQYEGGDGQDQGLHYRSHTRADGQLTAYARVDVWTYLSAWVMGSAAAVGTSVAVGSSIYTPNATVPFLSVEQSWAAGNVRERALAVHLSGMTVEGEAGQPWRLTTPFLSGGTPYVRTAAALVPSLETGDPAMYAGGAYLVNGATELDIRRFSYTFERTMADDLYTVTTFRRKVIPLSRQVSLDFQVIYQDQDYYRKILYGGAGGTVPNDQLATGSFMAQRFMGGSQLIQFDIPALRLTNVAVNRLEPDGQTVVLDVSGRGIKVGTGIVQHRSTHSGVGASAYLF